MIPTIEYIRQKFDEYNELMFEGKLKPLPFKLSSARSFLGKVRCCRRKKADGTWVYSDFQFIISNKSDYAENVVEDTIIQWRDFCNRYAPEQQHDRDVYPDALSSVQHLTAERADPF